MCVNHGPWILAADFNFPPSILEGTGRLHLVDGFIVSTGRPTCKGVTENDYFVVDTRLRGAVVGVAGIHDTGSEPHTAVRMWLKRRPRRDNIRTVLAPKKAEAFLPLGCLPRSAEEGWGDLADLSEPHLLCKHNLNVSFKSWVCRVEDQLADIAGLTEQERSAFCCRAEGPKFISRCALGRPGTGGRKFSAITVAWITAAAWLTDLTRAFNASASLHIKARALRVQWFFGFMHGTTLAIACMPCRFASGFILLPDKIGTTGAVSIGSGPLPFSLQSAPKSTIYAVPTRRGRTSYARAPTNPSVVIIDCRVSPLDGFRAQWL